MSKTTNLILNKDNDSCNRFSSPQINDNLKCSARTSFVTVKNDVKLHVSLCKSDIYFRQANFRVPINILLSPKITVPA